MTHSMLLVLCLVLSTFISQGQAVDSLRATPVSNATSVDIEWNSCKPMNWTLQHEGAPYLSIHFDSFSLTKEDQLIISDAKENEIKSVTMPSGLKRFSSERIPGESILIQFFPGKSCDQSKTFFSIDYLEFTYDQLKLTESEKNSICNGKDQKKAAVCFQNGTFVQVYEKSKAVARLLRRSKRTGSLSACTGFLIGSQGHLMTNHHCIKNQNESDATTFEFMVESNACDYSCRQLGDCRGHGQVVSYGAKFIYSNEILDYSLVQFNNTSVTKQYGFLALRQQQTTTVGESIYIPQYALGGAKQITIEQEDLSIQNGNGIQTASITALDDENEYGDFWATYHADTAEGSSGSPVMSLEDHHVIALHAQGGGCENSGTPSTMIIQDLLEQNIHLPFDTFI